MVDSQRLCNGLRIIDYPFSSARIDERYIWSLVLKEKDYSLCFSKAKRILIDVYAYWANYKDFLGGVAVIQSNNGSPAGLIGYNPNFTPGNPALTRNIYSISTNQTTDVKTNGWGASIGRVFRE